MLAGYYHSIGLYTFSSSEIENEGNEGESIASNELSHYSDVSTNSCPSDVNESATPAIDIKQFLAASTSDFEGSELISTDMELWSISESTLSPSSSPSSLCTMTSEYSEVTLPSYAELLDYSPAKVEQPQPTDSILVSMECTFDIKLRCPPDVEIIRLPILEQAISSLQDHLPPNIEEGNYIQVINTSPEYIEISSDSDVLILE